LGLEGDILFLEIVFFVWGEQRSCDGRRGAQRPVGRGKEPKTTGARSARARTRGQNPLVIIYFSPLAIGVMQCMDQLILSTYKSRYHPRNTVRKKCVQLYKMFNEIYKSWLSKNF
jgi:hypothetical protein